MNNLLPDEVLALTIWGEARGESIEGQVAVANVVMNRYKSNLEKYKTVADVCLEPKQFSCWNKNDPNYPKLIELGNKIVINGEDKADKILSQCLYIARGVMSFKLNDNTGSARNYMTKTLFYSDKKPSWANPVTTPKVIGSHIFFSV